MRIHLALSGGIGNQLFQYSKAVDLSRELPRAKVSVVRPTLVRTEAWERPRLQEWLGDSAKVSSVPFWEVLHAAQRKVSFGARWLSTYSDQWWFENGEFGSQHVNRQSSVWVRSLFHRKPGPATQRQLRAQYHETKSRRNLPTLASGHAALHIRLGDYMSERAAAHGIQPLAPHYYRTVFERLKQRSDRIFVITNGSAEQIEAILGPSGASKYQIWNGQDDYHDFSVMAGADHIGIANSTFSLWAAYLSNASSVLAPNRWLDPKFKTSRNVLSLYEPGWEVMSDNTNS